MADSIDDSLELPTRRKAWEQQETEPDKAFRAFVIFRGLAADERKMNKVEALYKKTEFKPGTFPAGQFAYWKTKYNWFKRARLYDHYVDAAGVEGAVDAAREMNRVRTVDILGRRKVVNERRYRDGMRAVKRGEYYLDQPTEDIVEPKGEKTITIKAVKADTHIAGMKLIKAGFELLADYFAEHDSIQFGTLDLTLDEIPPSEVTRTEDYRILTAIIYKLKAKVPSGDLDDIRRLLDAIGQRARLLGHELPKAEFNDDGDANARPPEIIEVELSPTPALAGAEGEDD